MEGGGLRWSTCGTDGCVVRVNFPPPALRSHIQPEDERALRSKSTCATNVGPHVQWRRYALGSSQPLLAKKLQIAGFDISRIGVSKIEARFSYVSDKTLLYLAEALEAQVQELFSTRLPGNRIYDLIEHLETMLFRYARLRTATHALLYYSPPIFSKMLE